MGRSVSNDFDVVELWGVFGQPFNLKAHHLAHQTFTDGAALDRGSHAAVHDLDRERTVVPLVKPRVSA
jgi:hypothetical protein